MSAQRKKIQFNIGALGKAPPPAGSSDAAVGAATEDAAASAYSPTRPTASPERESRAKGDNRWNKLYLMIFWMDGSG